MKKARIALAFRVMAVCFIIIRGTSVYAQTVLWADNYAVPNRNFDNATTPTGELAASNVVQESAGNECSIVNGQAVLPAGGNTAGLNFKVGNPALDYSWSTGAAGAQILAAGGMTVTFNWTSPDNGSGNGITFEAGINSQNPNSEIALLNNGGTKLYNDGTGATGSSFSVLNGETHSVTLTYKFSSWADGTPVTLTVGVDGATIESQSFTWNGNGGTNKMAIQSENNSGIETIGNFQITTLPPAAASSSWTGGAADYTNAPDWTAGVPAASSPYSGTNAIIDNGSNNVVQVNGGDPGWPGFGLQIGVNGSGAMVINGSALTNWGNVELGSDNGSTGFLTLSNGILQLENQYLDVGEAGIGVLNLSGGTLDFVNANDAKAINLGGNPVPSKADGTGTVNQNGGSVTINSGNIFIGFHGGTGIWNLNGGLLADNGSLNVGNDTGVGTWNINGGVADVGAVNLCPNGSGSAHATVYLNGGLLQAGQIYGANNTGLLRLNGGTLLAGGNNPNFISGSVTVQVKSGGAVINNGGFAVTIGPALVKAPFPDSGVGGLACSGSGTLTLLGANTYIGPTVVNAGTLLTTTAASGGGSYLVANGAGLGVQVAAANHQLAASNLTLAGLATTLGFDLNTFGNPTSAPLNVTGALGVYGTVTVTVQAEGNATPGQFPLVKYGSKTGSGGFVLGSGGLGYLSNNVANSSLDLVITNANGARAPTGINWVANHFLPVFATPAAVLDCIDITSASDAQIYLYESLEGIVNRTKPQLATASANDDTGAKGEFTWLNFHNLAYNVTNGYDCVLKYRNYLAGLVVTDPNQPDTVNLATTMAGVNDELICDPSLLTTFTNPPYSLSVLDDLRGRFANKYGVYGYLYTNYWPYCTHRIIAGLETNGDACLRDYCVAVKSAVVWLDPSITQDNTLLGKFGANMTPLGGVYMGWWPIEGPGLSWGATYGIPVLASDFYRNGSVYTGVAQPIHIPAIPPPPPLQKKVYVALIFSDGDNAQYVQHQMVSLWYSTARGTVPVGWTIDPLIADLDPAMLNYYWNTATANDCLVSGPSGAGYTHMELWTAANLTAFANVSNPYLQRSGLRVLSVWDSVNTNIARAFATNCPSLLGLLDQSGGFNSVNLGLKSIGLTPTYAGNISQVTSAISNAAASWNGSTPLFLVGQVDAWSLAYSDVQTIEGSFSTNEYQFVRPDHLFLLYQQANGIPASSSYWTGGAADHTVTADWTAGVPAASGLSSGTNAVIDNGSNNVAQVNSGDPGWQMSGLQIGVNNSGALLINGSSTTCWGNIGLGIYGGSAGFLTLSNGTINAENQYINIGEAGAGVLNISGGLLDFVNANNPQNISLGSGTNGIQGGSGTINQSGGTVNSAGALDVGNNGSGVYNLSGAGALNLHNWANIGLNSGGTGVLNLNSNAAITRDSVDFAGANFAVGVSGATGTVNQNGGSVTNNANEIWIGDNGAGAWNLNGGTMMNTGAADGDGKVEVGINTTGVWNINGGLAEVLKVSLGVAGGTGELFLNGGVLQTTVVAPGGGNGILYCNGGTLQAGANNPDFVAGLALAFINPGGAVIDSQAYRVTIPQILLNNGGGLTKNGTGTLTLSGANTYAGPTVVNAGTLATTTASSGGGSYTVAGGAGLSVQVASANHQLAASGLTLAGLAATLDFDLNTFGNPAAAPLNVTGALAVNGTVTVNVQAEGNTTPGQFPLIKYSSKTGSGGFVLGGGGVGYLSNNVANSSLDLVVTNPKGIPGTTLIWADNYVAPNGNFDNATTPTGELAASNVVQESGGNECSIVSDQAVLPGGGNDAGLCFKVGNPAADYSWSTGAVGAQILAAGGMTIAFNWTSPDTGAGNGITFAAGITARPPVVNAVSLNADSGIVLLNGGGTELYKNGAETAGNPFSVANGVMHLVALTYAFNSWADGTPVTLIASVDGVTIDTQSFTWNGNGGTNYMMLQSFNNSGIETIANFQVTLPQSPLLKSPAVSAGDLILTGLGGTPGFGYTWLTTTNLAMPLANWTTYATGMFDGTGAYSNAIPINNASQAQYFRLRSP